MKLDLLSIDEVATALKISRQQVADYLDDGRIPFVRLGGRRFIERRHAKKKPKAKKPGPKADG